MKHIKDIERLESILASGSKSRRSDAANQLCGAGEQNGRENAGKAHQRLLRVAFNCFANVLQRFDNWRGGIWYNAGVKGTGALDERKDVRK